MDPKRILLVEDEPDISGDVSAMLTRAGYGVDAVISGKDAIAVAEGRRPDLVLVDIDISGEMDGIATGGGIRSRFGMPLVYLASSADNGVLDRAKETAPHGFLLKPCRERELKAAIEIALHNHQIEEMLREAEGRFRVLFEGAPQAIFLIDPDTTVITDANTAAGALLGSTVQAIIGNPLTALHTVPGQVLVEESFAILREDRFPGPFECTVRTEGGREIPVEIQIQPVALNGRTIFHATYRNISIRKAAQDELQRSKEFLQRVIDAATDSIMVIGTDYRVQLLNETARRTLGPPVRERRSLLCHEISHGTSSVCSGDEHPCPLRQVVETGLPFTVVHAHVGADGSRIPFELTASPLFSTQGEVVGIIEVGRDISERVELEEERRRAEARKLMDDKDRSLVTIAGGMAHDFNNLLTSVMGNAELLRLRLGAGGKEEQFLDQIRNAATKMSDLTRQLLAYAKRGKYQPEILHVNRLVTESVELCRGQQTTGVTVSLSLASQPWTIFGDRRQMHQMLLNLFLNAFEAMDGRSGEVTVRVDNKRIETAWECIHGHYHEAGDYVEIQVRDLGPGIPVSQSKKIFEPFFTTHFFGRGLGLPAALGIVQNHGGCLSVSSGEEGGAIFSILLPRVEHALGSLDAAAGSPGEQEKRPAVLIIDDDPAVLTLIQEVLGQHGVRAVCRPLGRDALDEWKKEPEEFGLVLLDVQLEDMDGKNVYREMKTVRAGCRILLMSGFDRQTALGDLALCSGDEFLQKPFGLEALVEKVRALLQADGVSGF